MRSLAVVVGSACNLNCSYCFNVTHDTVVDRAAQRADRLRDAPTIAAVVKGLVARGYTSVTLTGGEPLIYKHVEHWLAALDAAALRVIVITNLTLVSPQVEALLCRSPHLALSVSLGGADAETHNRAREAFDITTGNLRRLAAGGASIDISLVLTLDNWRTLPQVEALSKELNCRLHVSPESNKVDSPLKALTAQEWNELVRSSSIPEVASELSIMRAFFIDNMRIRWCGMRSHTQVLNDTGELYGCFFREDIQFGNVLTEGIDVVFDRAQSDKVEPAPCFGAHCLGILTH